MKGQFSKAFAELSSRQKRRGGISYYAAWVNRPAGRAFAAAGSVVGMSPNQMTLLSALVSAVGIVLVAAAVPSIPLGFAVWLLLALGFMLDSADGQLARLTGRGSLSGEWLDHTVDAAKVVAIHSAVLISFYRQGELGDAALLVPLVYQFVAVVLFAGGILAELLLRGQGAEEAPRSTLRSLALLGADYGIFCLIFVLLGWPTLFFAVYAAFAALNAALLALLLVRWFRRLSSISRRQ